MPKSNAKTARTPRETPLRSAEAIDFAFVEILAFETQAASQQRRANETRARIVAAARNAFMTHSYNDVSTHEVSAAAGVTQGLITYHFKSKEGLWQAAMDEVFGGYRSSLLERLRAVRGLEDRAAVLAVIRHLVWLSTVAPSVLRIMAEPIGPSDQHLLWLIERHIRPVYDVVTHLFEVGQHRGVLRRLPIANAYYMLMTASSVFALGDEIGVVTGLQTQSPEFIEGHCQCLLAMLLVDPVVPG